MNLELLKQLASGFDHGFDKTNASLGNEVGLYDDDGDFCSLFAIKATDYDKEWDDIGIRLAAFYSVVNPSMALELIAEIERLQSECAELREYKRLAEDRLSFVRDVVALQDEYRKSALADAPGNEFWSKKFGAMFNRARWMIESANTTTPTQNTANNASGFVDGLLNSVRVDLLKDGGQ